MAPLLKIEFIPASEERGHQALVTWKMQWGGHEYGNVVRVEDENYLDGALTMMVEDVSMHLAKLNDSTPEQRAEWAKQAIERIEGVGAVQ